MGPGIYISSRVDTNIPQSFIYKTLPKYLVPVAPQAQVSKVVSCYHCIARLRAELQSHPRTVQNSDKP
jgi:hypothetical protein